MDKQKMTVNEYSALTGKSKQSIYKRIHKGTIPYVYEIVNGKKIAFILIGTDSTEQKKGENNPDFHPAAGESTREFTLEKDESTREFTPPAGESNPADNQIFTPPRGNEEIIEILKQQLQEKDKQIEKLQTQIETGNKIIQDLQTLFNQEQQLHAASLKLLPAETQEEAPAPAAQGDEIAAPAAAQEEKKGFWYRLFH